MLRIWLRLVSDNSSWYSLTCFFSKHLSIFPLLLASNSLVGTWVLPLKPNEDLVTKSGIYETLVDQSDWITNSGLDEMSHSPLNEVLIGYGKDEQAVAAYFLGFKTSVGSTYNWCGSLWNKAIQGTDCQWFITVINQSILTFEWPIGHDNDYCKWHKTIRIIIWVWIKSVNHNRCKSKEKWTSIGPSNPLHSSPRNNVPIWIQRSREQINDEIYSWNRYGTSSITNLNNSRR